MIDVEKMKIAFATTPLCQNEWAAKDTAESPVMLCAVSALVSGAGVEPSLVLLMHQKDNDNSPTFDWHEHFAGPVMEAAYGIPWTVTQQIPLLFDDQENEWRGIQAVIALCETHNLGELHESAIWEDISRFPQHGPADSDAPQIPIAWMSNYAAALAWLSDVNAPVALVE